MSSAVLLLVVLASHAICDSQSPLLTKHGEGGVWRHIKFYSVAFPLVIGWVAMVFGPLAWLALASLGVIFHAVIDLAMEHHDREWLSPVKTILADQSLHAASLVLAFLAVTS